MAIVDIVGKLAELRYTINLADTEIQSVSPDSTTATNYFDTARNTLRDARKLSYDESLVTEIDPEVYYF